MLRTGTFFGVMLLALASGLSAKVDDYPFMVIGAGGLSCGTWTAGVKTHNRRVEYEAWLLGYFSAVNRYAPGVNGDITRSTDGRGLVAWVDEYCLSHPLDQIETAAFMLTQELYRRNAR
jgi:hypothetical protein